MEMLKELARIFQLKMWLAFGLTGVVFLIIICGVMSIIPS